SGLKCAHDWLAESGERGLWPRGRPDSIHNVLCLSVDEDLEELLAALGVVGQRSVSEAKPSQIIQAAASVKNTATVQGPEPKMSNQDGDDRADCERRLTRKRFNPADIELLPSQ